ncbi:hypothetical protein [Thiomicrorhabdus sp.]|uniref:hypothetical protein n=1 Tax=Thiomicrorhabdus sp. TaxID=2039724 RepID=UPI0029C619F6|nr:hypothetical protein [Thiomicrorhabdus sp.]
MKNNSYPLFLVFLLTVLFLLAKPCRADFQTSYENAPLAKVVPTISVITDKAFTFAPESSQVPISLTMPDDKSAHTVYKLFVESLKVSGLKPVHVDNDIVAIVPFSTNLSLQTGTDGFQTLVVHLNNAKSTDLAEALGKLNSFGGFVSPAGDNKLLIFDTADQNKLISQIAVKLDYKKTLPDTTASTTLTLNNLKPSTVAQVEGLTLHAYDTLTDWL